MSGDLDGRPCRWQEHVAIPDSGFLEVALVEWARSVSFGMVQPTALSVGNIDSSHTYSKT